MVGRQKAQWHIWINLATPFILAFIAYVSMNNQNKSDGIIDKLTDVDAKLFKHLTNEELHAPRSLVVTKPEFLIYQEMRDKQMNDVKDAICDIRLSVREIQKSVDRKK